MQPVDSCVANVSAVSQVRALAPCLPRARRDLRAFSVWSTRSLRQLGAPVQPLTILNLHVHTQASTNKAKYACTASSSRLEWPEGLDGAGVQVVLPVIRYWVSWALAASQYRSMPADVQELRHEATQRMPTLCLHEMATWTTSGDIHIGRSRHAPAHTTVARLPEHHPVASDVSCMHATVCARLLAVCLRACCVRVYATVHACCVRLCACVLCALNNKVTF